MDERVYTDEDESLDYVTLSRSHRAVQEPARISDDVVTQQGNHLLYIGKVDLPHHPVRLRYLPYSDQRFLMYGKNGYQEVTVSQPPEFYTLQGISWETLVCDCVQTRDQLLYAIARCHTAAVLVCYDEFMFVQNMAEVSYPLGCLSSLTTDINCSHLYATNQELNCVLRFSGTELDLKSAERFGALWRPFDCCTSQEFNGTDYVPVQFLFVSNLDAGICVFDMNTMKMVAECGDDLSPGAKYLAYDPKRSLLFVSSSCDRLLRCYKFRYLPTMPPTLEKHGDFLVAKGQSGAASCGPQCAMWDPETENLAVIGWSQDRGKFCIRVFNVNV